MLGNLSDFRFTLLFLFALVKHSLVGGRFVVVGAVVVTRCRVCAVGFLFCDDADAVFVLFRVLPSLVPLFFLIVWAAAAAAPAVATREEVR